jgi:SAM-dependent methyltransferase
MTSPLPIIRGANLDIPSRFQAIASLLSQHTDLLHTRIQRPEAPAWCHRNGWTEYLTALSDDALASSEAGEFIDILSKTRAPSSLVSLLERVRALCEVPFIDAAPGPSRDPGRRVKLRKRAQIDALLAALTGFGEGVRRIVDMGAGHGHFTRTIAKHWNMRAIGLENNEDRVIEARRLGIDAPVEYLPWDVFSQPFALFDSDLVVGIHACGELGDVLVQRAADSRARVLLVSCCSQKVRAKVREPLSHIGKTLNLCFPRPLLGLANLHSSEWGVETSLQDTMRSRQNRYALRLLLSSRGVPLEAGAEMRGMNRRQALRDFEDLARRALLFHRLSPPTSEELAAYQSRAAVEFGIIRRLSLPRSALGRVIELAIVLDRASFLRERGYRTTVAQVFDSYVSPRNLGIFAACGTP